MMTFMSGICFARNRQNDSLIINRMWDYYSRFAESVDGVEKNVYMVAEYGSQRRNVLLYLVPNMYSIAKGDREYVCEMYGKLKFKNHSDFSVHRQLVCGTIPSNRNLMPALFDTTLPNIYGIQLYKDRVLSPFHRTNRFFYKYRIQYRGSVVQVFFRPRSSNTQLVNGSARVDSRTGRVISVEYKGEFDMITFKVNVEMDHAHIHSALPVRSTTEATFKFMGNRIHSTMTSIFNCYKTLPDSISNYDDIALMRKIRPERLSQHSRQIYKSKRKKDQQIEEEEKEDTTEVNTTGKLTDAAWDFVGTNLINKLQKGNDNFSLNISPLLNPLYMGYSQSKGLSYKLNVGVRYAWNPRHSLSLDPMFGYSFRKEQFYYTLPLRWTYNPTRNAYTELQWGNGNRTSNAALEEAYQKAKGTQESMPEFKDEYFQIINNVRATRWLEIAGGMIYHLRQSTDPAKMREVGLTEDFRSFAPTITIHLTPWRKGPTLTANYERSFTNILQSNLDYERWEFDAVYKYQNRSVRILNMRLGTGFYSQRNTDYFVDYSNFRDNNLPMGWEDDWTGQFQLLDSRWYNTSSYYIRAHVSYDSPLLMLSWVPWLGRIVETERIYLSTASIKHTRPYFEIGYGFRNRYFSTGFFASFLNTHYEQFGCKFTLELFRRW